MPERGPRGWDWELGSRFRLEAIYEIDDRGPVQLAEAMRRQGETDRDELSKRCPNVPIDPDLLTLVGIHPENPIKEDKALIRGIIARRLTD